MSRLRIDVSWLARGLAWSTVAIVCAAGRVAWAAQAAQAAQQEFVKLSPDAPREQLAASPLVFAAYGFVWVALIVYVFLLWRRIGRVEHELADVSSRLATRK